MKEFIIDENNSGTRLDKYLIRILPGSSFGFIQKMLRKKNITLNGKKSEGNTIIKSGDFVRIFFSDETFNKFSSDPDSEESFNYYKSHTFPDITVVFEDKDIIVFNKPFGTISQKANKNDISANELIRSHLIKNGFSIDDYLAYKPSVLNRLDRNTGGLIIAAKNKKAATKVTDDIKSKRIRRIYNAICLGSFTYNGKITNYYKKDEANNIANINDKKINGFIPIDTIFTPIKYCKDKDLSLISAELITGKSHQIRAVAAHLGHPLLNDKKYGGKDFHPKSLVRLPGQYLFAKEIIMPNGMSISANLPKEFTDIINY